MEEKINLYLDKDLFQNLENDMFSFGFYNEKHEPLRNKFINTVIVNYFELYERKLNAKVKEINTLLDGYLPKNADIDTKKLINGIKELLNNADESQTKNKKYSFALKPTKYSSSTINAINNHYLKTNTLSGYIRELLLSYSKLSRVEREAIVFKDNVEIIKKAIKENKKLLITTRSSNTYPVSPYKLMKDKVGLSNYLLALGSDNKPYSFRVSKLSNPYCLDEIQPTIPENIIDIFDESFKNGQPFINKHISSKDIIIKFNDDGIRQLNLIEVNRPIYEHLDKYKVRFDCLELQAYLYLRQFGEMITIESPESLKKDLASYFDNSAKSLK